MLNKNKNFVNTEAIFDFSDPFRLDDQLTEEELRIKSLVKSFSEKELLPKIIEQNRYEKYVYCYSSLGSSFNEIS